MMMMKMRFGAMKMSPTRIVIVKKMISLEKKVMQRIPPIGRNAANADHPSRARCLCHFSKRPLLRGQTCPTRSVLSSCTDMSAKIS